VHADFVSAKMCRRGGLSVALSLCASSVLSGTVDALMEVAVVDRPAAYVQQTWPALLACWLAGWL